MKQNYLIIGGLILAIFLVYAYKKGILTFSKKGSSGTGGPITGQPTPQYDFSWTAFVNSTPAKDTLYMDAENGFQQVQPGWQFPMLLN